MNVIKRNGSEVQFDASRIYHALHAANQSVAESYRISDEDISGIVSSVQTLCEVYNLAVSV